MSKDILPKLIILLMVALVAVIIYKQVNVNTKSFEVKGRIAGIGPGSNTVIISHVAIPGYSKAATKAYSVKDSTKLKGLKSGEAVSFHLHVNKDSTWITGLHQIADSLVSKNPAGKRIPSKLKPKKNLNKEEKIPTIQLYDHKINFLNL